MDAYEYRVMEAMNHLTHKRYLGDSVYASFDGSMIVLATENGLPTDPTNIVCLEPEVLQALIDYNNFLKHKIYPQKEI